MDLDKIWYDDALLALQNPSASKMYEFLKSKMMASIILKSRKTE